MFNQIEEMPLQVRSRRAWSGTGKRSMSFWTASVSGSEAINVAPLVGHSVLQPVGDGRRRHAAHVATDEEIEEHAERCCAECLQAGAVGLSTSFVDMDETLQPVPSRYADTRELDALAAVLSASSDAMLQIVPEFYEHRRWPWPGSTSSRSCRWQHKHSDHVLASVCGQRRHGQRFSG